MTFRACYLLILAAALLSATPITDLANSGVFVSGNFDTRWQVQLGTGTYGTAYRTDLSGFPAGAWLADNTTSYWISPQPQYYSGCGGCSDAQNATYTYRLQFQLPTGALPNTAHFEFRVAVDNQVLNAVLNGTTLADTHADYRSFSAWFPVTTGFVAGLNEFEIVTFNLGGTTGNPAGLRVEFRNADVEIPEPATALLVAAGLLLFRKAVR